MDDGRKAYRMIKIIKKTEEHIANLSDDYISIYDACLNLKKQVEIEEWIRKKIDITYISLEKDLLSCDLLKKWNMTKKKHIGLIRHVI